MKYYVYDLYESKELLGVVKKHGRSKRINKREN